MKTFALFLFFSSAAAFGGCFDKLEGNAKLRSILTTPQFGKCECQELKDAQALLLENMKSIRQTLEKNFPKEMAGEDVKNLDFYTFMNQINSARAARAAILSVVMDKSLGSPCVE